ncbi:cytosine-specific methyltransferase [Haematococcus lacustris]|uniref:Cytosine-specific methyltransferase n=1 Tax=Haematococcus lacustris TaxID=44745 RepID=A0A699Y7G9_HAELA|nr:cytosine-specific methyltransferase [Haematococcus lacustris]
MLSEESRASKLSFNDIVKRLADLPDSSPAFISKKVERVERFVVVHGQIVVNQFTHFPNKAVQKAAFVDQLKAMMSQRKHNKLYMSKVKPGKASIAKTGNANPMRNRAATGLKAKPMAATGTTMGMAARPRQPNLRWVHGASSLPALCM